MTTEDITSVASDDRITRRERQRQSSTASTSCDCRPGVAVTASWATTWRPRSG